MNGSVLYHGSATIIEIEIGIAIEIGIEFQYVTISIAISISIKHKDYGTIKFCQSPGKAGSFLEF
jgi:hypothetical protein